MVLFFHIEYGYSILEDLKKILDRYMKMAPEVKDYCDRCLSTQRWGGNITLMVVDACFTSIGLNYFKTVVPKVMEFEKKLVKTGRIVSLEALSSAKIGELRKIWRNRRSWEAAKSIARHLTKIRSEWKLKSDREAFIYWARNAKLQNWGEDSIGKVKGVGINTFQYLRMMGGVDTVMPDKIVKRVVAKILKESNVDMPKADDLAFIETVHEISRKTKYRAIEICWMTWLIQSEAGVSRSEKYSKILPKI